MPSFSIVNGNSTTILDTTPDDGFILGFTNLDNSFSLQINGVDLFVGGPAGAENELQFQTNGTQGQTVRFADDDLYGTDTPEVWQLSSSGTEPIVRLIVNPDGTIELFGVRENDGALEPLELFNGMTVNTAAIAAVWDDDGPNSILIDQSVTGPTNADGNLAVCFTSGTLIETLAGPKRVDDLQVTDQVLTYDNEYEPILWIGSRSLSHEQLEAEPKLKPILIRADALGAGYPKQDLIVSPQHRILVSSAIALRMFDSKDVLIPAKKLLLLDGIDVVEDTAEGVQYFHILFDAHQIIWSNGAASESLFTGVEALNAVSTEARQEIMELFPECCDPHFRPVSARYIPEKGRQMSKLIERHQTNRKPLFDGQDVPRLPM